jgi:predicted nucleotidyltransferase
MVPASMRRRALAEFVTRLRDALGANLVELRLFGSEARGDASPESDIDVLVVVRPDDARIAFEDRVIDVAFDVNVEFGVYISPRVVTPSILSHPIWGATPFLASVRRDGVPL